MPSPCNEWRQELKSFETGDNHFWKICIWPTSSSCGVTAGKSGVPDLAAFEEDFRPPPSVDFRLTGAILSLPGQALCPAQLDPLKVIWM